MAHTLIDEISALTTLLDSLGGLKNLPPSLFVDLEGDNLSRHGTISILQLFLRPQNHVYLIDVHRLGADAFHTAGSNGSTSKSVLESPTISKVFFDVRNDSDALYNLYHVMLAGVDDLQLMELATRKFAKRHVNGLKKCIERDAIMTSSDKQDWIKIKDEGHRIFDPKAGGSYAVFNERPLLETVQKYCTQDVFHLPGLWELYSGRLSTKTWVSVRDATKARVEESQSLDFNGKGQHMALSPWPGWPTSTNPRPAPISKPHWRMDNTYGAQSDNTKLPTVALSECKTRIKMEENKTPDCGISSKIESVESDPAELDMASLSLIAAPGGNTNEESRQCTEDEREERLNAVVSDLFASSRSSRYDEDFEESTYDDDFTSCGISDGSESPRDYTACIADDCGYCGHCSY